ncbi:MAG: prepilin-type N-terminal cleavage/methylation domain-containing protein [Kiritimatiellae bacterium]|nr:prepilin-type N-terminal cleavage/methylation domain-containing protein [Kiritimatiellia bacterium]
MRKQMKKGFTLVEIMIVVAIIAILAAVAIPNFIRYRNDSRTAACIANMKQLQTAAESYLTKHPGEAPTLAQICGSGEDKYLKSEPKCPKNNGTYTIALQDGAIKVTCSSGDEDHVLQGDEASGGTTP